MFFQLQIAKFVKAALQADSLPLAAKDAQNNTSQQAQRGTVSAKSFLTPDQQRQRFRDLGRQKLEEYRKKQEQELHGSSGVPMPSTTLTTFTPPTPTARAAAPTSSASLSTAPSASAAALSSSTALPPASASTSTAALAPAGPSDWSNLQVSTSGSSFTGGTSLVPSSSNAPGFPSLRRPSVTGPLSARQQLGDNLPPSVAAAAAAAAAGSYMSGGGSCRVLVPCAMCGTLLPAAPSRRHSSSGGAGAADSAGCPPTGSGPFHRKFNSSGRLEDLGQLPNSSSRGSGGGAGPEGSSGQPSFLAGLPPLLQQRHMVMQQLQQQQVAQPRAAQQQEQQAAASQPGMQSQQVQQGQQQPESVPVTPSAGAHAHAQAHIEHAAAGAKPAPPGTAASNGDATRGSDQQKGSAAVGSGGHNDPMMEVLLMQVESLMRDRAALQNECGRLSRENDQMQELVGYLYCQLDEVHQVLAAHGIQDVGALGTYDAEGGSGSGLASAI